MTSAPTPVPSGRFGQLRAVWRLTRQGDPAARWWMLAAFVSTAALGAFIGWALFLRNSSDSSGIFSSTTWFVLFVLLLVLPMSVMMAMIVMARRAEQVAYKAMGGQPGAALAPLQNLRRGWNVDQEPVAIDPKTRDLVFRAVGRPGVVLIVEGPMSRTQKLAENERKRHARVLSGIPIHTIHVGDDEGQVPLRKLTSKVMRLKVELSKAEVSEVIKRLRALGGVKIPVPKGIDPTKVRPTRSR